jgi:hypothetical protein
MQKLPFRPKMCLVALVIFFATLAVENQMHGFLMVFKKSFASEKILNPRNTSWTRT